MSRYHVGPGEKPPPYLSHSERLSHALRNVRAAMTHVRLASSMHRHLLDKEGADELDLQFRGLALEESSLCALLEKAIDREAKAGRAA